MAPPDRPAAEAAHAAPDTRRAAHRGLDLTNLTLADVRDGLGPYLAIYLLTAHGWNEAATGTVLAAAGIAGLLAQTPAGALVDATTARRGLIAAAAVLVALASLAIPLFPEFWPVVIAQVVSGTAASVFAPAVAAITLGVVGPAAFARRMGRNEAFNHGGNALSALLAGGLAFAFGPIVVFWLLAAVALASLFAAFLVPQAAIDPDLARGRDPGTEDEDGPQPSVLATLAGNRPLMLLAGAVALFHLANAAMLPLVGQKLASQDANLGTTLMSACIVAAQLVMIPMAALAGARADSWGRKPLMLAGFAVLTVRGALYVFSDNMYWLVAVQLLDGVGAGLLGALLPVMVADLTRGSGRFNVSLGAVTTAMGAGAALSNLIAGPIAAYAGYSAAFLTLAALAGLGLAVFWRLVPETRGAAEGGPPAVPAAAAAA